MASSENATWMFPEGLVTGIYYIRLEATSITGADMEDHVRKALRKGTSPEEVCAYLYEGCDWVQIFGHANFRAVYAYLRGDGRILGNKVIKILTTNECTEITLRVPEFLGYATAEDHLHMYNIARRKFETEEITAAVLDGLVEGCGCLTRENEEPSDRPQLCPECLACFRSTRQRQCQPHDLYGVRLRPIPKTPQRWLEWIPSEDIVCDVDA